MLLNTLIGSLLFLPLIFSSYAGWLPTVSHWFVPSATVEAHLWVFLKAIIVLSSWICGYFAMKHLPITLVGPINATRPVMTLLGAMLVFHEQFNLWQWAGVALAIFSFLFDESKWTKRRCKLFPQSLDFAPRSSRSARGFAAGFMTSSCFVLLA